MYSYVCVSGTSGLVDSSGCLLDILPMALLLFPLMGFHDLVGMEGLGKEHSPLIQLIGPSLSVPSPHVLVSLVRLVASFLAEDLVVLPS